MARIFISHASEDNGRVREVFDWLIEEGHSLFYDENLQAGLIVGEDWKSRLYERLRWADAVVCLITSAYVKSIWCTAELTTAINRGSRLLPMVAESGVRHPLLDGIQLSDYSANPERAKNSLAEALRRLDAAGGRGWTDGRNPFPGLRPFPTDMRRAFFGRRTETDELAVMLRSPEVGAEGGLMLVVGPSGCGKSSLVRAGLLPVMADEPGWLTLPALLPGTDPVGALSREIVAAARISGVIWATADVRERLTVSPMDLINDLLMAARGNPRSLLILVDQLEELISVTGQAERETFGSVLESLIHGHVRVVGTVRPESLAPLLASSELANIRFPPYSLRPLTPAALPEIIRGPAEMANLHVDEELVAKLVDDTEGGDALPLLGFTLEQLAARLGPGDRLSTVLYDELGGVRGALKTQANAALKEATTASGRREDQVIGGLLRLVTVDDEDRPARLRIPLSEVTDVNRHELAAFVSRRLLVTDNEDGQTVIGVAHEAFFSAWPPLAEAIKAAATSLRTRRTVERTARDWDGGARNSIRLITGGQLSSVIHNLGTAGDIAVRTSSQRPVQRHLRVLGANLTPIVQDLSPTAQDFLTASVRADQKRRFRLVAALSVLLIFTSGLAIFGFTQRALADQRAGEALGQERAATARLLQTQATAAAAADPRTALKLRLAAYGIQPDDASAAALTAALAGSNMIATINPGVGPLTGVAYSSDGGTLAIAAAGSVLIFDLTGLPQQPILQGRIDVGAGVNPHIAFAPSAPALAVSDGLTVGLWDISHPADPIKLGAPLVADTGPVTTIAFSPHGDLLQVGGRSEVMLWNISDLSHPVPAGPPITPQAGMSGSVQAVFSPDGQTLAIVTPTLLLWDVSHPDHPTQISTSAEGWADGYAVAFRPDGKYLATAGDQQKITLWNVTDRANPTPIGDPLSGSRTTNALLTANRATGLAFSPDGNALLASGQTRGPDAWDVTDIDNPKVLNENYVGHTDRINAIAVRPVGASLASVSDDGTAIVWMPANGPALSHSDQLAPSRVPVEAGFVGDSTKVVTANPNDGLTLWDLAAPARLWNSAGAWSLRVSTDRSTVVSTTGSSVALWRVVGSALDAEGEIPVPAEPTVALSADGQQLAVADDSAGTVTIWSNSGRAPTEVTSFPGGGRVVAMTFDQTAGALAVLDATGAIRLWNISGPDNPSSGRKITPPDGHKFSALTFAPVGHLLAVGTDSGDIAMWDTASDQPTELGQPMSVHTASVTAVAFAADGATLVSGADDNMVSVFGVTNRGDLTPLVRPIRNEGRVASVSISSDGQSLAVGGAENVLAIWDLTPLNDLRAHPVERACAAAGGGLSSGQWQQYAGALQYTNPCNE